MSAATYSVSKSSAFDKIWRKVQGPLRIAANFVYPEWDELQAAKEFDVDWSTREITAPFDIEEGVGVSALREGGHEAVPSSPAPIEGTFTFVVFNKRFSVSRLTRQIEQKNAAAQITSQFRYQGRKALEAFGRRISVGMWSAKDGILAKVSSITSGNSSGTIVIVMKDGFAQTDINGASYLASLLRSGERVALLDSTGVTLRGFATCGAPSVSGSSCSVTLTFLNSATPTLAAGDIITIANSMENTTIADGTDYGVGTLTGWMDVLKATTIQGINHAKFKPQYVNTTSGRFTTMQYRRMKQAIQNAGGTLKKLTMAQGVENDITDQLSAGLRFDDAFALEMDGAPKAKNVTISTPRTAPNGYVIAEDTKSHSKMTLLPKPGQPTWDDGEKIPDIAGHVYSMDYPCQVVWENPALIAYASNQQEQ